MDEITSILRTVKDADVTHILAHRITTSRHRRALKRIAGYEHFDQRALILARPDHIVCVLGKADRPYVRYLSHLGLGPMSDRIIELDEWSGDGSGRTLASMLISGAESLRTIRELIPPDNRVVLDTYYAASVEFDLAAALEDVLGKPVHVVGRNAEIVRWANLKDLVYGVARELSILWHPGRGSSFKHIPTAFLPT